MKLVIIPPYRSAVNQLDTIINELVANLRRKGQLEKVEIDVDDGYFTDHTSEHRDEAVLAQISVGFIRKAREYSEIGKHDAIISSGGMDPGFAAARLASRIPVVGAVHSTLHIASLIGQRFSIIHPVAQTALIVKHLVERYGFAHRLGSVRFIGHWPQRMAIFIRNHKKEERVGIPEGKKIVDDIVAQCIAAIERDRADSLIFACEQMEIFEDEARKRLDEAGYNEIPIICDLSAGVEVAKALVNMKLVKASRAYPGADLRAKPEYW